MSLHDDIMRLPCTPPADANINQALSYKSGHRDARHAAAELAAGADEDRRELLEALEACRNELASMIGQHNVQSETDGSWLYDYQTVAEADAAIAKARGN